MRKSMEFPLRVVLVALIWLTWWWAYNTPLSKAMNLVIIVGGNLLIYALVQLGRMLFDRLPTTSQAAWATTLVHFCLGFFFGIPIIRAVITQQDWSGWVLPVPSAVGLAIVIWSIWFLPTRHGRTVFLGLFITLFLVGGGIGQVFFFIPAWAFATRISKPMCWQRKILPRSTWPFLSKLWIFLLAVSTRVILIGLEMAIFGYFSGIMEPEPIQNIAMLFVMASAILNIMAYFAGLGHELNRMEGHH